MISDVKRRSLARRAAARGMTVEQYIAETEREHDEQNQRYLLMTNNELQFAVLAQHAGRRGSSFTKWSV